MNISRLVIAIIFLLMTISTLILSIWLFLNIGFGIGFVTLLISIGMSLFVYHDYKYFFKNE